MFLKILLQNFYQVSCKCQCRRFSVDGKTGFSTPKRNYYEILGVPKTATKKEIKNAYVELSKKFHPDSGDETDKKLQEKFVEISEACRVLTRPELREAYDRFLEDQFYQQKGSQFQAQHQYVRTEYEYPKRFDEAEERRLSKARSSFIVIIFIGSILLGMCAVFFDLYTNVQHEVARAEIQHQRRAEIRDRQKAWDEYVKEHEIKAEAKKPETNTTNDKDKKT